MNNIELEQKIKELIEVENYFDFIEKVIEFEKEYKQSEFYKKTRMALKDVIKECRIHYGLKLDMLGKRIQKLINELDFTKVNELLDQFGDMFGQENAEIKESLEVIKDLKN